LTISCNPSPSVGGSLINNGHSIVLKLDQPTVHDSPSDSSALGSGSNGALSELDVKMNRADQLLNQVIGESASGAILLGELQTPSLMMSELTNSESHLASNSFGSLSAHLAGQFAQAAHSTDESIAAASRTPSLTVSGGPLSYTYTIHALHLHFGRTDELGSEHFISGFQFPAEVRQKLRLLITNRCLTTREY
jgi:hypothetical protein